MPEVATGEIGETATLETDEEWGDDGELNLFTAPSGETNGDTKERETSKDSASGGTHKAAPQEIKDEEMSSPSERHLSILNMGCPWTRPGVASKGFISKHGENTSSFGENFRRGRIFKNKSILPNNGKSGALIRPMTHAAPRHPSLGAEEGCRDFF